MTNAKKPKRRAAKVLHGVRFEPSQLGRITDYCSRLEERTGVLVEFSAAIRALVDAGLERSDENEALDVRRAAR